MAGRRTLRAKLLLAAGAVVVAVAVVEGALRARAPALERVVVEREVVLGRWDPLLGWSPRPGLRDFQLQELGPGGQALLDYRVSTNTLGLRGAREYGEKRARRVVCVGDSFT